MVLIFQNATKIAHDRKKTNRAENDKRKDMDK